MRLGSVRAAQGGPPGATIFGGTGGGAAAADSEAQQPRWRAPWRKHQHCGRRTSRGEGLVLLSPLGDVAASMRTKMHVWRMTRAAAAAPAPEDEEVYTNVISAARPGRAGRRAQNWKGRLCWRVRATGARTARVETKSAKNGVAASAAHPLVLAKTADMPFAIGKKKVRDDPVSPCGGGAAAPMSGSIAVLAGPPGALLAAVRPPCQAHPQPVALAGRGARGLQRGPAIMDRRIGCREIRPDFAALHGGRAGAV